MNAILNPVLHGVIAICLLAAYAALRWHGVDEPVLLGILGGQLGGLGVTNIAAQAQSAPPQAPPPVA